MRVYPALTRFVYENLTKHHFDAFDPLTGHSLKITFQVSDLDDPSAQEQVDENGVMIDPPTEDVSATPFITCALLITKSATPGAMSIDLEAGEEGFEVTNVAMFEKAQGEMKGAEGDWARRSRYMGPRGLKCISQGQLKAEVVVAIRV